MSSFTQPAVDVVAAFAHAFAPLLGTGSVAAAVVLTTVGVRLLLLPLAYAQARAGAVQRRLAPAVTKLRNRHKNDPVRLQKELGALYKKEGASQFSGCLPALVQAPFFMLAYQLFSSSSLGGTLFGTSLGIHPFTDFTAVCAGVLLAAAAVAYVHMRQTASLPRPEMPGAGLMRWMPFGTVVSTLVIPLAAGLYLLTSSAWTAAERPLLRRLAERRFSAVSATA